MTEIKCNRCNNMFLKKQKHISYKLKLGQTKFYCSAKCSAEDKESPIVEKVCLWCKLPFTTSLNSESPKCCSRKCSAKYSQSFVDPDIISIKSKEAWERGCFDHLAEKIRKYKTCEICNNKFYGHRKYCSLDCLKKSNPASKISKTRKEMFENKTLVVTGGTTKWIKYRDISVQGSYEYRACLILDNWKSNGKIKDWEYTNDRIQYVGLDGKPHNYLLDFKVFTYDGGFYYIETKGYKKDVDELKWAAVKNAGHKLVIWFKDDLSREEEFIK